MMAFNARAISGLDKSLSLWSLIRVRIVSSLSLYFVLSCFYCMVSLAFQAPFNRKFGHAGFLVYWMISWFGMVSLGLALEAMITLLTPKFIPFFLILWIISAYLLHLLEFQSN